jgi:hypothetical protein
MELVLVFLTVEVVVEVLVPQVKLGQRVVLVEQVNLLA